MFFCSTVRLLQSSHAQGPSSRQEQNVINKCMTHILQWKENMLQSRSHKLLQSTNHTVTGNTGSAKLFTMCKKRTYANTVRVVYAPLLCKPTQQSCHLAHFPVALSPYAGHTQCTNTQYGPWLRRIVWSSYMLMYDDDASPVVCRINWSSVLTIWSVVIG